VSEQSDQQHRGTEARAQKLSSQAALMVLLALRALGDPLIS
jgi:hypothetical protein